ncbi:MAG TPA: nuclear transport factor 2 family protein [Vicinamibacterales bacterium]|nr:nuclear transport factor 2 family protein [Vicinamibacterales bacterium]
MRMAALCFATVLAAACSDSSGPAFDAADQDKIKAVIQQLTEAFNAKDAAKAAALYTPEAVVMPPNKSLSRGRRFVEQYYTSRFGEGATELSLQPNEIKGSGTLAVAMGDYRLTLAPAQGPRRRDRGKFVWIFRELNNAWMIDGIIFSSDFSELPPA